MTPFFFWATWSGKIVFVLHCCFGAHGISCTPNDSSFASSVELMTHLDDALPITIPFLHGTEGATLHHHPIAFRRKQPKH